MPGFKQADRPLTVTTPLGEDVLLLRGFTGREGISQLFSFELDLLAEQTADIAFDKLLGQPVTIHVRLPDKSKRHFNGICARVSQGERDSREKTFTGYRVEIVPKFWLLTHKAQSRIFQHLSVPDILKKVLTGIDVTYEIQGTFEPRDFCVQYRETDFNFASRLMEEEGIYYFFKHSDGSHKMVVANKPDSHSDVPGKTKITYEEIDTGVRDDDRIFDWEKVQELRSGKYTLFDHCFELPHQHLDAQKTIQDSVTVGKVSHKLKVANNDQLEVYDYPGGYAQRFDGIDKGGGEQSAEIQKIFKDNVRTVEIRMQEEARPSVLLRGAGNCRHFTSGHKFTLEKHFSGEGGPYVLTTVTHSARGSGDFLAGVTGEFVYRNEFTCIPLALPFRPPRTAPKPVVHGTQTAVVVGPPGEEIFTDKYGRVKVQFHWDREGKKNADSSCWIRVSTLWAGKQWGMIHIPRIGQEVIVDFLEGDPDQPIVVGSVYNAEMMPPYKLPQDKTQSGIKTRSTLGGDPETFNEICFEDKKGQELLYIRAEKDQTIAVENDEAHWVGHDRDKTIGHDERTHVEHDRTETVDHDEKISIGNDRTETVLGKEDLTVARTQTVTIGQSQTIMVGASRSTTIATSDTTTVLANRSSTIAASESVTVGGSKAETVGGAESIQVGGTLSITAGGATTISVGGATMITSGAVITITAGGAMSITAGGAVAITAGGAVALTASAITLSSAIVMCAGVLMAPVVVAAAVASPVYSPGLGNML